MPGTPAPDPDNLPVDPAEIEQVALGELHAELDTDGIDEPAENTALPAENTALPAENTALEESALPA